MNGAGRRPSSRAATRSASTSLPAPETRRTRTCNCRRRSRLRPWTRPRATGISYAIVLEAPIPDEGLPATIVGFQVASESRSTYRLTEEGWKIASREYTTLFVDPE